MDSFFGIGIFELFLIAVIALVVLGPERLPGAMRTIASYFRQIREVGNEFTSQFSEEIKMLEEMDPRRIVNDVLDPSKTPAKPSTPAKPATTSTAKPAATSNAAKSAAAAAAVAKNAAPPVAKDENNMLPPTAGEAPDAAATDAAAENVILPPEAGKRAAPANGTAKPTVAAAEPAATTPSSTDTSANDATPRDAEPTEPKAAASAED